MKDFILNIIKYILYPYGFIVLCIYALITIMIDILIFPLIFYFRLKGSDDKYFYFLDIIFK